MKKIYFNFLYSIIFIVAVSVTSCETKAKQDAQQQKDTEQQQDQETEADISEQEVMNIIEEWPDTPREVANKMIGKYGQPDEATPSMLIWNNNGDWKRTIVYKEEVEHNFPMPHSDLLEQTIDYQLDIDKYSAIAQYDGSVFAERTKGELSARCDKEAMNYLAINLAHEIEQGKRTVEEAREFYAETAAAFMMGESSEYTEGFLFKLPKDDATDPDEVAIEEAL